MRSEPLPEPWRSFLLDLDKQLAGPTELHCFGGFVVAQCYGLIRPTADIDILDSKGTDLITIAKLAGRTSPLHKRPVYTSTCFARVTSRSSGQSLAGRTRKPRRSSFWSVRSTGDSSR